ncbi:NAD(P)-dependent dehydrogenase, short-chain alcohol dehydrogenase family [Sphingomonas gellani]|uniref:NAD(P)-dependent dehydrogenase, short-chain alcohol dehydrogenase family n=1 Tax=Sphingomonas gellani TaxID=1166340 RepID=A0A1H8GUQ5_9SPHN|nr:SDR family oxidoreductase [Sphingomonas gellani]SEN47509.1 NAD(P)-dependent dehydrogenase, short-chain alcohol dehydrogenase family [Sphingomonas gellani]
MPIDLTDAHVLVVGASGGIGRATADAFAAAGAQVARPPRDTLDIADDASVEAFFAQAEPFDHVVVAAAQTRTGPVAGLDLTDATAAMNSKFFGAYRVARAARVNDGGSITFVSGFLSQRPSARSVLQGAINAALEALARGLALERAPVRVNTVSPGLIDTPLYAKMDNAARQAMFDKAAARLPARRVGKPEDIAQAILFVATNPYATGSTVTVDGGGTIAA